MKVMDLDRTWGFWICIPDFDFANSWNSYYQNDPLKHFGDLQVKKSSIFSDFISSFNRFHRNAWSCFLIKMCTKVVRKQNAHMFTSVHLLLLVTHSGFVSTVGGRLILYEASERTNIQHTDLAKCSSPPPFLSEHESQWGGGVVCYSFDK